MINKFLTHIQNIKGYSPATATAYGRDLREFAAWARDNHQGARWSTITSSMVVHYIMALVASGEQPTTTNRKLSAITSLYRYINHHIQEIDNPAQFVSRRKVAERLPNTIDPEQLRAAYENAIGSTRVMLGLLATTGIRIGELLAITWGDINLKERSITIHGKGSKDRKVSVPEEQLTEIRYAYPRQDMNNRLFNTSQYESRCMIYRALMPYCRAKQLSPHAIRHTYATEMAKAGANAPQIAAALGHRNIKTTQHYIDNNQCVTSAPNEYIKLN